MIKLIKILSEIRIIPNVTPEMVTDLYDEVRGNDIFNEKWIELNHKYINVHTFKNIWVQIQEMDPKTLKAFYTDLIQFKKDIHEIKIIPNISSKMVSELFEELRDRDDLYTFTSRLNNILKKYPNIIGEFKYYNSDQLKNIYKELLELKNEISSK